MASHIKLINWDIYNKPGKKDWAPDMDWILLRNYYFQSNWIALVLEKLKNQFPEIFGVSFGTNLCVYFCTNFQFVCSQWIPAAVQYK